MITTVQYISLFALCGTLVLAPYSAHARGDHMAERARGHTCQPWQENLSPEQREKAEQIVAEARPHLAQIRQEMREKMQELKSISYNNQSDPEDLARLGRQLQQQRDTLMQALHALDKRLKTEVGGGAQTRQYDGRGCAALEEATPCPLPQPQAELQTPSP